MLYNACLKQNVLLFFCNPIWCLKKITINHSFHKITIITCDNFGPICSISTWLYCIKTTKYNMFSSLVVFSAQGRFAQKLLNDLMENYSNALRPVEDTDKALNVTLQITLSQIKDMVSTKHTHTQVYGILTLNLGPIL